MKRLSYIPNFWMIVMFTIVSFSGISQVLVDMADNRNMLYASSGYNATFGNYTIGYGRREYIRFLKKEFIGIVDISLPVSGNFFTKYFFKKGFQFDIFKQGAFRLPFVFASSSIYRQDGSGIKYDDVTAEFTLLPGIYKEKFSIALDARYEIIVFRRIKNMEDRKSHWTSPFYSIAKVGIFGALNFKRFAFYIKTGYERNPLKSKKDLIPVYGVIGIGFKWGTRPMNKSGVSSQTTPLSK